MEIAVSVAVIVGSYLLGSIPSAYWLGRLVNGTDVREHGTGNVGVSNFAKLVSKKWAVPLALFDIIGKGTVPVLVASAKVLDLGPWIEVGAGLAAVTGHNWSCFIGFKGGRGMTTVLGALGSLNVVLCTIYLLIAFFTWLINRRRDSVIAWNAAIFMLLPIAVALWLWADLSFYSLNFEIIIFCAIFIAIVLTKRLTYNLKFTGIDNTSPREVMINRLLLDRDIKDREEWISRNSTR